MTNPSDEVQIICLPSSKLSVKGDSLVKESWENQTIARHPLAEIESIELKRGISFWAIFLFLLSMITVLIALTIIQSAVWSAVVTIAFTIMAFVSFFSIKKASFVVKTHNGTVAYDLTDSEDSIQGFKVSLSELVEKRVSAAQN